jgi:hypothetical protein
LDEKVIDFVRVVCRLLKRSSIMKYLLFALLLTVVADDAEQTYDPVATQYEIRKRAIELVHKRSMEKLDKEFAVKYRRLSATCARRGQLNLALKYKQMAESLDGAKPKTHQLVGKWKLGTTIWTYTSDGKILSSNDKSDRGRKWIDLKTRVFTVVCPAGRHYKGWAISQDGRSMKDSDGRNWSKLSD